MSDYVDDDGRPKSVVIRGKDAQQYTLWDQIVSGSVSLSTQQITQMTLSFREAVDRWPVLSGGYLQTSAGRGQYVNDASCDIGPLNLQIGTLSVEPLGASAKVTIEARSLGGQRLKASTDPSTLSNVSYSQWVRTKVESLGMKYVGEGSPTVAQVGNSNGQDSWTTIQKLAGDLGFWAFEAAGTFYFARPSWLLETQGRSWVAEWRDVDDPQNPLLELPSVQQSTDFTAAKDKPTVQATTADVTVKFKPGYDGMRPGDALILKGIPGFEAKYIITSVDLSFGPGGVVTVKAETPVDPVGKGVPQQSAALQNVSAQTGTTVRDPGAGSYGGTRLSAEQTGNVKRILQVCQDRGLNPRGGLLALMCALQESSLRNLQGGDRDSAGLFQQRPSQGWGTKAQVTNPEYATGKFLDTLLKVKDWQTLTPTVAVQKVQRSAYPNAYARWQPVAQALLNAALVTRIVEQAPTTAPVVTSVGGVTTKTNIGVRPLNGSQTYQQISDIGSFGPASRVTSTTGGGHSSTSYHYKGQAVDFAWTSPSVQSTGLDAIYTFWARYAKYLAELIYNHGVVCYKNGKPFMYSSSVMAIHKNHVHVAITDAGIRQMISDGVISFR